MNKSPLLGAVCAGVIFITSAPVFASVIYTYEGNNYTWTSDTLYNTTMNISVELVLADFFAPPYSGLVEVTPISFSLSDGVHSLTDETNTELEYFALSTDSLGNISDWFVLVVTLFPDTVVVGDRQIQINAASDKDIATVVQCTIINDGDCSLFTIPDQAINSGNPGGAWTVTVIPVPAAVWLFGSGLLGLVGIARRKKTA